MASEKSDFEQQIKALEQCGFKFSDLFSAFIFGEKNLDGAIKLSQNIKFLSANHCVAIVESRDSSYSLKCTIFCPSPFEIETSQVSF